jgi:hypothetical protein
MAQKKTKETFQKKRSYYLELQSSRKTKERAERDFIGSTG